MTKKLGHILISQKTLRLILLQIVVLDFNLFGSFGDVDTSVQQR